MLLITHLCSVNEGDALIYDGLVGCEIVFPLIVSPVALLAQQTLPKQLMSCAMQYKTRRRPTMGSRNLAN